MTTDLDSIWNDDESCEPAKYAKTTYSFDQSPEALRAQAEADGVDEATIAHWLEMQTEHQSSN